MIKVYFFAGLKRFFIQSKELEYKSNITPKDIIKGLKNEVLDAADLLDKCRVAFNEEFISADTILGDNDELFLIPPSSGG